MEQLTFTKQQLDIAYPFLALFAKEASWRCGKGYIPISRNCYTNQKTGKIRYKYIKNPKTGRKKKVKVPLTYKEYQKARTKVLKKIRLNKERGESFKKRLNTAEKGYAQDIKNLKRNTRINKYGIWEQKKKFTDDTHINILRAEDKIKKQTFETVKAFDDFGNELFSKNGNEFSVPIDNDEMSMLKDKIVTHNHPENLSVGKNRLRRSGSSFSGADIILASELDVKEIRVVTPKQRYSLKRPKNGWKANLKGITMPDVVNFFQREVIDEVFEETITEANLKGRAARNKIEDYLKANQVDVRNKRIAKYLKAPYKKVPWKKATKAVSKLSKLIK